MSTADFIKKVYDERREFILIGLTGRTGSGCSTVAKILSKNKFTDLDLTTPKSNDFNDSEERKYAILYNYMSENDNWKPFTVITMASIITWIMIENSFSKLYSYIEAKVKSNEIGLDKDKLKKNLCNLEDEAKILSSKIKKLTTKKIKDDNDIYNIYENVKSLTYKLKGILVETSCEISSDNKSIQLYTYLYQEFGTNIRSSGNPFNNNFIGKDKFFALAEKVNFIIKLMREKDKEINKPTLVCIDAIRNPYEASFFRDRYSAFYLMSINTEDDTRQKRLSHMKLDEILRLDETEYPTKLKKDKKFTSQNIGACLQISDIHVYNPDIENGKYFFLTEQILKYLVLMIHPGYITPTHIERCMQIAYNTKLNSGCLSRQVGAVVTNDEYAVMSVGWNDVPKGHVSCSLRDINMFCKNKDKNTYSYYEISDQKFEKKLDELANKGRIANIKGRKYPYCFKDVYNDIKNSNNPNFSQNQVYTRALHAEENAFLNISKYGGVAIQGGFLFTTASPCELCAKKAYQLGIKKIYYIDPYPGISQDHILKNNSKFDPKMVLFFGAIGAAYIALYTPKVSYKDEIDMLLEQ